MSLLLLRPVCFRTRLGLTVSRFKSDAKRTVPMMLGIVCFVFAPPKCNTGSRGRQRLEYIFTCNNNSCEMKHCTMIDRAVLTLPILLMCVSGGASGGLTRLLFSDDRRTADTTAQRGTQRGCNLHKRWRRRGPFFPLYGFCRGRDGRS